MALENLTPATRLEQILDGETVEPATRLEKILTGDDIDPATRMEYFIKKAVNSGGGGGGVTLPKITITLNIDHPEECASYRCPEMVDIVDDEIVVKTYEAPAASQTFEGYIIPTIVEDGQQEGHFYIEYLTDVYVNPVNFDNYFENAISNMVNCSDTGNGSAVITDPKSPASCTINSVYIGIS